MLPLDSQAVQTCSPEWWITLHRWRGLGVKFGGLALRWYGDYGVGHFSGHYYSAYQSILENVMLPTLWEQFGNGFFLSQHDSAQSEVHQHWMREFGVEELPGLVLISTFRMNYSRDWARPSHPPSVSDLTNVFLEERSEIHINTPRRVEAVIAAKGWQQQGLFS